MDATPLGQEIMYPTLRSSRFGVARLLSATLINEYERAAKDEKGQCWVASPQIHNSRENRNLRASHHDHESL